jgi:hypothetical protein
MGRRQCGSGGKPLTKHPCRQPDQPMQLFGGKAVEFVWVTKIFLYQREAVLGRFEADWPFALGPSCARHSDAPLAVARPVRLFNWTLHHPSLGVQHIPNFSCFLLNVPAIYQSSCRGHRLVASGPV